MSKEVILRYLVYIYMVILVTFVAIYLKVGKMVLALAIIYMLVFPVVFPYVIDWAIHHYYKSRKKVFKD